MHAVRAEPRARAHRAGLDPRLHNRVRRGQPDDPVQGQVGQGGPRPGLRRPVHLPRPAGRRHPALPGRPGAGRRGPAAAPGAEPDAGPAVQPPLRPDVRAAAALHPGRGGQDLRPAGPDGQDEQVLVLPAGHRRRPRRAGRDPPEDRPRGHRPGLGGAGRPGGQAGRDQPAADLLGAVRRAGRHPRGQVRGRRLRRVQEGPGRAGRGQLRPDQGDRPSGSWPTRPGSTACSPTARPGPARSPARPWPSSATASACSRPSPSPPAPHRPSPSPAPHRPSPPAPHR